MEPVNGLGSTNIWQPTSVSSAPLAPLDTDTHTRAVIIGAGFTGLSTALHLAESGHDCVVIEADQPGAGESGSSTGWLEPNWWMQSPRSIIEKFGPKKGEALSRWVASGPDRLRDWVSRYSMNIDFHGEGLLLVTRSRAKANGLEAEAGDWCRLGVPFEFLPAGSVREHFSADGFVGGLLLKSGGTLNPLSLCREMVRACRHHGVPVFGETPALAIHRRGSKWLVRTRAGHITADSLVLATGVHTGDLCVEVRNTMATWYCCVAASAPYADLDALLPKASAVGDLDLSNVFTVRSDSHRRLIVSLYAPLWPGDARQATRPFMRKFRRLFPHLQPPEWQLAHVAPVGISADKLPAVHAIGETGWSASGYSGTGINHAIMIGGDIARRVLRQPAMYPVTAPEPLKFRNAISWALRYLHAPAARQIVSLVR